MDQLDEELLMLLATDLDRYFEQLMLAYQHQLHAFVLRLLYSQARRDLQEMSASCQQEAEDIVQDAFIRAYYALQTYPVQLVQALKLRSWLYKITLNVFYNRVRKTRLSLVSFDAVEDGALHDIEDEQQEQPDVVLESVERRHELEMAVATLPERYCVIVTLYYFEDLSYREIAELLGLPIGSVKSSMHRGIQLLRTALDAQKNETR